MEFESTSISSDQSNQSETYGSNLGTKIIVIIKAKSHFKKDKRLKKNPLAITFELNIERSFGS